MEITSYLEGAVAQPELSGNLSFDSARSARDQAKALCVWKRAAIRGN